MSPVPPPAGAFVPSDDWTEDPSFDLSPSAHHFALPTSPSSSSTSSTSHRSYSNSRQHASSPLRQSYTGVSKGTIKLKKREDVEELLDFDEDGFDLPTSTHNLTRPSRPRSSTSSSITRTVIGSGPTGVGTITKLGSSPVSQPSIMKGTVKARALAIEKSWEADVDFDDDDLKSITTIPNKSKHSTNISTIKRLTLSPPRKGFMPPPDALDNLGFDLDEEDQATLKAGATIKAMLPPPSNKNRRDSTIKSSKSNTNLNVIPVPSTPPNQDPDSIELESDFALPLNLTNLTLATQPQHSRKNSNKSRISNASTTTATTAESWDSPGSSNKKGWGWGSEDSPGPSDAHKRRSETSATSISDALPETSDETKSRTRNLLVEPDNDLEREEDDMENGLILPSPTFFSNKRSKELNSILDKKRKPQFAPTPKNNHPHHSNAIDEGSRRGHHMDDSFEDGLVLDEPGVELSKHRLREKKRARDKFPISTIKQRGGPSTGTTTSTKSVAREREKAWEKQRERDWGRVTPVNNTNINSRERTHSTLGLTFRSNSASAGTLLKDGGNNRVDSPSLLTGREKESMRSRSGHIHSMLPPPPSIPPAAPTATPSSRLRHQKSHYHLAAQPTPSPNLARKQSLASLQDALADRTFTPSGVGETPRYHNSTSRLTMPTSSSKAKSRPPINSIFPTHTPQSSASSSSSIHPSLRDRDGVKRMVDMPKRSKTWGDGSELDGIDDLTIDDDQHKSTIKGSAISGLGLGKPSRRGHEPLTSRPTTSSNIKPTPTPFEYAERRKKSGSGPTTNNTTSTSTAKRKNRKPALIKHFGVADKKKVVGEMTWNPSTLRWEGNESILRDFDTISTSARPALITHYTGSSVGVGGLSSPVGSAPAAPRIVGDMQFDPIQMKWVSILSPEEDEPDPFEGMADDEDDEFGFGTGTITRSSGRKFVTVGLNSIGGGGGSSNWTSRLASESSVMTSTTTNTSASTNQGSNWDENGSGMVSEELWKECKMAEERHKKEMKGWIMRSTSNTNELRERERKEEKRLWEIRNLAMKS
ncbi:hypothetical protein I203_101920 [Kwoniella mangroviensis CBS 8507]|uniref:uncharacterized protein n=1 Tax=Kwoniella mangroviensis CBS 8507 TaxID=1296122 RepID=UPI00080D117B|nr:uncharacterized protein I203_03117 [Kwoniella mangroviensis CBS 8507]OCF67423.1 hypothetical protein I203_03117 [Kwoniella mangroviensis CBS 8507]